MRLRRFVFLSSLIVAVGAASAVAGAQGSASPPLGSSRSGVYHPASGDAVPWSINSAGALVWGGTPFVPFGVRVGDSPDEAKPLLDAGLRDFVVDVSVNGRSWSDTVKPIDTAGGRYLIRLGSAAPSAFGYAVEPMSYRVSGIKNDRTFVVDIPGATRALVVSAAARDGAVTNFERVPVVNGKLVYEFRVKGDGDYVMLVYPEMDSLSQPDYWDRFDEHRDRILESIKHSEFGAGLRGIVNPLGQTATLPGRDPTFVPTTRLYQLDLKAVLDDKYRNVDTAVRNWGIRAGFNISEGDINGTTKGKPITNFDDLVRLVPLWKGTRGVAYLYDPIESKIVACDNRISHAWDDINEAINRAAQRRYDQLVRAIREVSDVPVIQEWAGWASPYERSDSELDGLGMCSSGDTLSEVSQTAARAASSVLRWKSPGWLVATDIDVPDAQTIASVGSDLLSMGARGLYLRKPSPEAIQALAGVRAAAEADSGLASNPTLPVFYPENASEPAAPQRLPGGRWWLPSPAAGNRIDFGSQFFAYRVDGGQNPGVAIWTTTPGRVKLLFGDAKPVKFVAIDGSDLNPKIVKNGIEVSLSEVPVIVTGTSEIPVPEPALEELVSGFALVRERNSQLKRDIVEEETLFLRYATGLERAPGVNYAAMRELYERMCLKVGDLLWIEAESTANHNFGDAQEIGGCSRGYALTLAPRIYDERGFFAAYSPPVRSTDELEVWVAARIPAALRSKVRCVIGSQVLTISGPPTSVYGQGFGWYRLGTTRMSGNQIQFRIEVDDPVGLDMALDAIVMGRQFTPSRLKIPEPFVRPPSKPRK